MRQHRFDQRALEHRGENNVFGWNHRERRFGWGGIEKRLHRTSKACTGGWGRIRRNSLSWCARPLQAAWSGPGRFSGVSPAHASVFSLVQLCWPVAGPAILSPALWFLQLLSPVPGAPFHCLLSELTANYPSDPSASATSFPGLCEAVRAPERAPRHSLLTFTGRMPACPTASSWAPRGHRACVSSSFVLPASSTVPGTNQVLNN